MKVSGIFKKVAKGIGIAVGSVIALFFMLAVAIYLPPVQEVLKNWLCDYLSEETGMKVRVERVRLSFPLDLLAEEMSAVDKGDTVVAANQLLLDVKMLPLIWGDVDLNGFELRKARINTKDFISDVRVEGQFTLLAIDKPSVAGLLDKKVDVNRVRFKDSDFKIILSDTAQQDTTPSEPVEWRFAVNKIDIKNSRIYLQLPGDSMRITAEISKMLAEGSDIDLKNEAYKVKSLMLVAPSLAYDIPYEKPVKGFDPNHLLMTSVDARFSDFAFDKKGLNVDLSHLGLKEKSGLAIEKLSGAVHYDSTRVDVRNGHLRTPYSEFDLSCALPFSAFEENGMGNMELKLDGTLDKRDVKVFAGDAIADFDKVYPDKPIDIKARLEGTMQRLAIDYCHLTMPGNMNITLSGTANELTSDLRRNGRLHYMMDCKDLGFVKAFIPRDLQKTLTIPRNLKLGGDLAFYGNKYDLTQNTLYCGKGSLSFTGTFNAKDMSYQGKVVSRQFPLQLFLPGQGLSPLTAQLDVKGRGTDFLHNGTNVSTDAVIGSFTYSGISLNNVRLKANLIGPKADGQFLVHNSWLNTVMNFTAEQSGDVINGTLQGSVTELALNMGIADTSMNAAERDMRLMMDVDLKGFYNSRTSAMGAAGTISHLNAITPTKGYPGMDVKFMAGTSPDSTHVAVKSGDLVMFLKSMESLDNIIGGVSKFADEFTEKLMAAQLNHDTLKTMLPNVDLYMRAGTYNPLQQLANMYGYSFDSLRADVHTSRTDGLAADIDVEALKIDALLFDKTCLVITQDAEAIRMNASVENTSRKNPNKFKAYVDGALMSDGFSVLANFVDKDGRQGLNIGTRVTLDGVGGMSFKLIPEVSTLAFRKFTVNSDNFVTIDSAGIITANVNLKADDNTALQLFSVENPDAEQDITLVLNHLNLRDLSQVVPMMPPMAGLINGDVRILKQGGIVTATASLNSSDLVYDGTHLGALETNLFYAPEDNSHYVNGEIMTGGQLVATLDGQYHDEDNGILDATLTLEEFPCNMLNPLMGDDGTFALRGAINGEVSVKGPTSSLVFDGNLKSDSVFAYSELYGFDLRMEDRDIVIDNGKVMLDKVHFFSAKSENPLTIDGSVDFSDMDNMLMDLTIKAKDFELINAKKTKKSLVYGNVSVDMDAVLKGRSSLMVLRGTLSILGKTNVTYVLTDTPLEVEDQFAGLVEFVDFNETDDDEEEEQMPMEGLFVDMVVVVNDKAHLHCDMSADGKSYLDCTGGGQLKLRMFPNGMLNLTGRYNINDGQMKYTLPFIPLKTFEFQEGSYIVFNGEATNPTLNITAMEKTKAAVTDDGGASRMVNFNVGVAITRQVSNMGLEFLIEAPDDGAVQGEIATMSTETKQRTAVAMLATGIYLSSGNSAGFMANNALNAFLDNEIQNIAGNALKTIDFSVGVQGNTTLSGETQTDYTYQFSKKLWNDRVKFVIGGKVSTGASDNSSSQSFVDNISLEYQISKNSTRYIRIFYDNDTRDALEGSYSSAGAGYIFRRKTNDFGELLLFKKRK